MRQFTIVFVVFACASVVCGQSNNERNELLADSLRTELFAQVDRCTAGMEWTKIASRRKGRRIKMKGKKQYMTIKRVIIARPGGTHDRLVVKQGPRKTTSLKATLVNDRLVFAQWTAPKQEGGYSIPVERIYVEGRLFLVRAYDENGAAQAMHTESLTP